MQSSISKQALLCLGRFREVSVLRQSWSGDPLIGPETEDIHDSWARFRVWVDNIGAVEQHVDSQSSLDYRLRHSTIRSEVLRLLSQLASVLEDLQAIFGEVRVQQVWSAKETLSALAGTTDDADDAFLSDTASTSDALSGRASTFSDFSEEEITSESNQLYMIANDAISSLLGLSLLIKKSSRGAKFARSAKEGIYGSQHDRLYIEDRFAHARSSPELVNRLSLANARRRQWLSYRQKHREKLAVTPGESGASDRQSAPSVTASRAGEFLNMPAVSTVESTGHRQTVVSSTNATSLRESLLQRIDEDTQAGHSDATSYIDTHGSIYEEGHLFIPPAPPEVETGKAFECQFCYTVIAIKGLRAWKKHIHADLSSYVCTFPSCNHELFESRSEWFNHELEHHRLEWVCSLCSTSYSSISEFTSHALGDHVGSVSEAQLPALVDSSRRPTRQISATACQLCDFESMMRDRLPNIQNSGHLTVSPKVFRQHLGQHLEQVALFVLPREATKGKSLEEVLLDRDDGGDEEDVISEVMSDLDFLDDSFGEDVLNDATQPFPDILDSSPDLALGWLPPQNFTPPEDDFASLDPDMVPRREDSLFGGDVFTPGWVRGHGQKKQGYCGRCVPGIWYNISDKSYERNLTFMHGIPSNGIPLPRPSTIRQIEGESQKWEAYCDKCKMWRKLKKTSLGWNWFWHCLKEHGGLGSDVSEAPPLAILLVKQAEFVQRIRAGDMPECEKLLKLQPAFASMQAQGDRNALHFAADAGRERVVELICNKLAEDAHANALGGIEAFSNAFTSDGETPLTIACAQGHEDVVRALLERGADVNLRSAGGQSPLDNAAEAGYNSIVKLLLDKGADTGEDSIFNQLRSARKRSIQSARSMSVPGLPQEPVKVDRDDRMTQLHIGAAIGDLELVQASLEQGSLIDDLNSQHHTALMIAGVKSHTNVMQFLLRSGANTDATTDKGWTALMLATRERREQAVEVPLANGADVNHLSPDHWTALAEATVQHHHGILKRLLDCGADTETKSSFDWTPLMHAAWSGDTLCTNHLLNAGADMEVVSLHDETALLLAIAGGHNKIVNLFLDAGCRCEPRWVRTAASADGDSPTTILTGGRDSQIGWTPAMLACQTGNLPVLRRLLDVGASLTPVSPMGKTAVEIARENGHTSIADYLTNEGQESG